MIDKILIGAACVTICLSGNVGTMSYISSLEERISEYDIYLMAQTIKGEADGCSRLQKEAVGWCIINRVECEDYPGTISEVILQPKQFHGYWLFKRPEPEDIEIAREVITKWIHGEERTLPAKFLFFHSNGRGQNVFTTDHRKGEVWEDGGRD